MRHAETQLSDQEEQGYRDWLSKIGQAPGMGGLDKTWTHKSYDLRGVYKKYGPVDIRHTKVPEEFKKQGDDLRNGPQETQDNWAKRGTDNTGSHDVSPWYNNNASSSFGNNMPWELEGESGMSRP